MISRILRSDMPIGQLLSHDTALAGHDGQASPRDRAAVRHLLALTGSITLLSRPRLVERSIAQ